MNFIAKSLEINFARAYSLKLTFMLLINGQGKGEYFSRTINKLMVNVVFPFISFLYKLSE